MRDLKDFCLLFIPCFTGKTLSAFTSDKDEELLLGLFHDYTNNTFSSLIYPRFYLLHSKM